MTVELDAVRGYVRTIVSETARFKSNVICTTIQIILFVAVELTPRSGKYTKHVFNRVPTNLLSSISTGTFNFRWFRVPVLRLRFFLGNVK